jgi:inorganic pyrophosphatase
VSNPSNLVNILPAGKNPPREVNCLVEIPRGISNKYEYDKEYGLFRLDRVLYEAVFYPTEYGIIPQTLEDDGDPIDIMVLSTFPTFPGCLLSARPIGAMRLKDTAETDTKIVAVPADDPRFDHTQELEDLPPHTKKEIQNFWENYVELQPNKRIKIEGWSGREKTYALIESALARFRDTKS